MPNTKANDFEQPIDERHQQRAARFQQLFSWTFTTERITSGQTGASEEIRPILSKLDILDAIIQPAAPERPLADINKVDLTILRLMIWEANTAATPKKVLVDEGIELAKAYGTENSPKFINATLARLLLEEFTPSQELQSGVDLP